MKNTKQNLHSLLADGKTEQVIAQLRQLTTGDKDLHQQVLMLAARLTENERQRHSGTSAQDDISIERNKINNALLAVMDQLPDGGDGRTLPTPSSPVSKWVRLGAAIATAIGLLAGIAELSGYSIRDLFEKEANRPAQEQPTDVPSQQDTLPSVQPPMQEEKTIQEKAKEVEKKDGTTAPRNHFESHDSSKQINIPDNKGTIKINI